MFYLLNMYNPETVIAFDSQKQAETFVALLSYYHNHNHFSHNAFPFYIRADKKAGSIEVFKVDSAKYKELHKFLYDEKNIRLLGGELYMDRLLVNYYAAIKKHYYLNMKGLGESVFKDLMKSKAWISANP